MAVVTLTDLLIHADISVYAQFTWLRGAEWHPPYVLLADHSPNTLWWIERHYLPKWRELVPTLELRQLTAEKRPLRPAATKYPSLKATGPARRHRDLLDAD